VFNRCRCVVYLLWFSMMGTIKFEATVTARKIFAMCVGLMGILVGLIGVFNI
jgi:hypothetical protein